MAGRLFSVLEAELLSRRSASQAEARFFCFGCVEPRGSSGIEGWRNPAGLHQSLASRR